MQYLPTESRPFQKNVKADKLFSVSYSVSQMMQVSATYLLNGNP